MDRLFEEIALNCQKGDSFLNVFFFFFSLNFFRNYFAATEKPKRKKSLGLFVVLQLQKFFVLLKAFTGFHTLRQSLIFYS